MYSKKVEIWSTIQVPWQFLPKHRGEGGVPLSKVKISIARLNTSWDVGAPSPHKNFSTGAVTYCKNMYHAQRYMWKSEHSLSCSPLKSIEIWWYYCPDSNCKFDIGPRWCVIILAWFVQQFTYSNVDLQFQISRHQLNFNPEQVLGLLNSSTTSQIKSLILYPLKLLFSASQDALEVMRVTHSLTY